MLDLRMFQACILSTSASAIALALLLPAARRLGLVDHPDQGRKRHAFKTPLVGGLAIAIGILAGWWYLGTSSQFENAVICTALGLVLVGVIDDLINLKVWVRVIAQLVAIAIVVHSSGVYINSLGMLHGHELTLGWLSIPFTVVAVIGLLNAFNLIDGMDGLAGCLTLVAAIAIEFLSKPSGSSSTLACVAVIAAAVVPYLAANLGLFGRNGNVFLGDAGSIMLGYLLAWSLIGMSQTTPRQITPGLVLWCVALPVFDTLTVMCRRLYRGESPFTADRGHIHHLLTDAGLKPRTALMCLVLLAAAMPFLGYAIHTAGGPIANMLAFATLLALYAVATTWYWRTYEKRKALPAPVARTILVDADAATVVLCKNLQKKPLHRKHRARVQGQRETDLLP